MKQVQTVAALCAVLLAAQAVSADPSWFSPEGSSQSQAKTSSYYADALETELSCLSQMNFRSCRFTGYNPALQEGGNALFGDLAVQTDFGCCSKEHRYGHREDIGMVGTDGKIGTCDWNINLYWWNSIDPIGGGVNGQAIAPVVTADGSALKFGTVTGTCYFSSAAEQCDHPLCERMVLSFQGGLYVSRAYGFTQGPVTDYFPVFATSQDTCANPFSNAATGLPNWPQGGFGGFPRKAGDAGKSAKSQPQPANGAPAAKQGATTKATTVQQWTLDSSLTGLMFEGIYYLAGEVPCLGGGCNNITKVAADIPLRKPSQSVAAQEKVKASMANANYAYAPEEKTYAGYAMVVSGPFSVVSSNDNQIKQTGIMEFSPTFLATPTGTDANGFTYTAVRPTNKWPIIRGQTAKLRFTKEKQEQYYGKDTYQGEGKDSYQAHEPDRKDAYYGNDNKDDGHEYYGREAQRA